MTSRPTVEGVSEADIRDAFAHCGPANTLRNVPHDKRLGYALLQRHDALRQQLAELRLRQCACSWSDDDERVAEMCNAHKEACEKQLAEMRKECACGHPYACGAAEQPSRGKKLSLSEAVEAARGHADPVRDLSAMRGDCAQPERQVADASKRNIDGSPLYTCEALEDVRALCEYAYENGYHEHGYDPVKTIEQALRNARGFVAANWPYPKKEGLAIALADLGATPVDAKAMARWPDRTGPSPPQDDIVAGLRDCLIRSKPEGDEAVVPIKLWERAIAALERR